MNKNYTIKGINHKKSQLKTLLIRSIPLVIFFFTIAKSHAQIPIDNSVELKYVSTQIKASSIITLQKFDSAFAKSMYTDTIVTKPELFAKLWNTYKDVTYSKDPKVLDIRYKVTLYFSVYTPPVYLYIDGFFNTVDDKGIILKGPFLKTLHHMVDAIMYKKKL